MEILEQFREDINGHFTFFDRVIITGRIRRFDNINGAGSFASQIGVPFKDFSAYEEAKTKELKAKIEKYAHDLDKPLIYLNSPSISKDAVVQEQLAQNPVEEGLICILSVLEECKAIQPIKNPATGLLELRLRSRKCLHYYFYMRDREFGYMFFRLQTWFPYMATVYINGREWMRKTLEENQIEYAMYDNSFSYLSDIEKAQQLADKKADNSRSLQSMLDKLALTLNPMLAELMRINEDGYQWYLQQCEIATDIMFKSREKLEDIYPSLVDHAFYDFSIDDVFTFLGRRITNMFQGEAVTDYKKRPVGWRVKFKLNSNHIKFYDKANCLRVELTINRPQEFKIYGDVHHNDGTVTKQWKNMGKSLSNLYRYYQVGRECNMRLIRNMENIVPVTSVLKDVEKVCESKKDEKGRTTAGLNVWKKETYHLLKVISDGRYLLKGFRNSDIRAVLYPEIEDERKQSAKTSRTLRKLREHHIIKKVPHSSQYYLTKTGRKVTGALIHIREHMYPEAADKFN